MAKQVPYFKDDAVSIVYSNYFEHNQKTKKIRTVKKNKIYSGFIQEKIIHDYHIGILTTLIRKNIFKELGGYNNFFHICGDFEFNVRASENNKIVGITEPLGHYRVHDENMSRDLEKEVQELNFCLEIFQTKKLKNINKFENYLNNIKCIKELNSKNFLKLLKCF